MTEDNDDDGRIRNLCDFGFNEDRATKQKMETKNRFAEIDSFMRQDTHRFGDKSNFFVATALIKHFYSFSNKNRC